MAINKYLIPSFTTPIDPASFGLKPVQFIGESMGIEEHKRLAKSASRVRDSRGDAGPVLLNCEKYPDNAKAAKEILEAVDELTLTSKDVSVYLPSANVRAWEGAGETPGGGVDRLDEIRRARRQMEAAAAFRCSHVTIDAWQLYDRDDHGICFAGLSPMETWRLMVLQRICVAEETRLPVRAVIGIVMVHNGAKIETEARVPTDDLIAQTRFLVRRGIEPILLAGWSDLRYDKTREGRMPFTREDRRAIEAFAKA
jgi:hypothetical protein